MVAASPAEAVALTEGLDAPIDLLLTDLIMPGGNGQALAERLLQKRPSMRVMMMSGYGAGLGPIPTDGTFHFMAKPFGRDELTASGGAGPRGRVEPGCLKLRSWLRSSVASVPPSCGLPPA